MSTTEIATQPYIEDGEFSIRRVLKLYARGLALRCPNCGSGGMLESWFKLKRKCPKCGLRTERAEEDFFLGAMMFNIVISEGLLVLLMLGLGIVTWPAVPWNLIWYGGIVLMAIAPFAAYPFSHTVWLASDIMIRPVTVEEMEWYRTHGPEEIRPFEER